MERDESRIPDNVRFSMDNERMIVVGAGGIGAWFVINVALSADMLDTTLMVCDGDILELTNLGRLPYPLGWVGKNKANALQEFIQGFMERADRMIVPYPSHLNVGLLKELMPTTIVDCCDNQTVQEQIKTYVRSVREDGGTIKYIRLAGDSGFVTVTTSAEESYAGVGGDGYLVVPSWAGNVMLPAILGFHALVTGNQVEIDHKAIEEYLNDGEAIPADRQVESAVVSPAYKAYNGDDTVGGDDPDDDPDLEVDEEIEEIETTIGGTLGTPQEA